LLTYSFVCDISQQNVFIQLIFVLWTWLGFSFLSFYFTLGKTVEINQMLPYTAGREKSDHSRNYAY